MKSFRSGAKNLTKRQFPWKNSDFQDLAANFPENEGLVDDSGLRRTPQTGKDPQMQTSAMVYHASMSDEGAVFAESLLTKNFAAAVLKSVQLTVSKTPDAVILSTNSHTISCACSVCALPPVEPELIQNEQQTLTASATTSTTASATLDLSKTFFLNSLAGARHTIYLDFDGHTTSGTGWNTSYAGGANIVTPAFDFDGNTASFSSAELERIQYIWQRVAEDFSPFNVNVTTQAPTDINDLIKSSSSDTRWGVRVVIGGSSSSWFGSSAGGVAYRSSFNWNTDTPTFVFSDSLGDNEKYTAEAITHEVGHTLGLSHDGRSSPAQGYYRGHGSGQTGWAPIMGTGYYQNLTQWSKGEYGSANNTQDDLQIITTNNGFSYRADDTGNTIATAKRLTVLSSTTLIGSGIIERNTDIDYYSFTTVANTITITVNPFTRGPNLDIWAGLYNSGGTLIASSNPPDLLSASITISVAAGTYYLAIDGVGKGDPLSTGYTDYGSLGQYFIEVIGNEIVYGSPGDDTLEGLNGNYTLIGYSGNDTYIVDRTTNTIIENAGEGTDTISSSVTFSLAALPNIENLTLTGTAAINGTGNAANNVIIGNSANNSLDGGDGNDSLNGGAGNDILNGGAGNDILTGGTGKDTLTGGLGVDRFDYRKLADSLLSNFDVITDFNANAGNDLFLVSTARAGFSNVGTVATLDTIGIAAKLTTATFASNFAALFTFGSRSFVAINNATAGFSATTDAIIEVTGFTGTLGIDNFTTALV
jgi:Ca2+-binding RTX toxin-like protein